MIHSGPRKAPTGVRYSDLQSQQFTLHWEPIPSDERAGPSVTYHVNVQQAGRYSRTGSTSLTIGSLRPNSVYSATVAACTNYNSLCGPSSPAIQVRTLEKGMWCLLFYQTVIITTTNRTNYNCMQLLQLFWQTEQTIIAYSSYNCQQLGVQCKKPHTSQCNVDKTFTAEWGDSSLWDYIAWQKHRAKHHHICEWPVDFYNHRSSWAKPQLHLFSCSSYYLEGEFYSSSCLSTTNE